MVQVDGSCSGVVKPARDQLQGNLGLLNLLSPTAQAHICSGGVDLQPSSSRCQVMALQMQCSEHVKNVDG